jgi:hypothetical protein
MYIGIHVKYRLLLSDFNETLLFSIYFRKNTQIPNFVKIRPVGAEAFHADGGTNGQTDRQAKLLVALRSFASAPKIVLSRFYFHASKG